VKTDEQAYLKETLQRLGTQLCGVVKRIVDWAKQQKLVPMSTKWETCISFIPIVETAGGPRYPFSIQSGGDIWVQMRWLRESSPFSDEGKRKELQVRLNGIPGVTVPPERMTGFPRILVQTLQDEVPLTTFLDTMSWLVAEIRAGSHPN
jgi:hypothetical protein